MLNIYPDQQTLLNRLVTDTDQVNEIKQAALMKSLLESERDKTALDISDEVEDGQFQVPIVPNIHDESVFQ